MSNAGRPSIACATLYDEPYAPIGWVCRNTLTRYGQRHGHDVVVARSAECDRHPGWYKIRLVQALFAQGYDYVFWVDADAMFVDFDHDIAALASERYDMHLVQHELPWYPIPAPNTGVFLLKNCAWSRDLLDRVWSLDQYSHATWWENAAFMHLLGLNEFREQGVHNPNGCEIDASRIEWLPERWNRLHQKLEPGSTIIRHYAGKSRKHRLRHMFARLNWPAAMWHEAARRPEPIDLTSHGVLGAELQHRAAAAPDAPSESLRNAA